MTKSISLRYATLLATVLLAFGLVTRGHAQNNDNLATLDDAYATLAHADHDYKGHRARAMKQIELAVQALGGSISGKGRGHEPQATSDEQLRAAQGLLGQVTGLKGKAAKHLARASKELGIAFSIK
jgi:hypothetical protein